jgi:hypothetical protein
MHQNAVPEVPSQKGASQNGIAQFFPGFGVTNTTLL